MRTVVEKASSGETGEAFVLLGRQMRPVGRERAARFPK
jgi:hypothetical protein